MSGNSELIKYPERMAQLKSYRELFIGKHTPSDIDLAYEVGGKVFVFGELKHTSIGVPTGQSYCYNILAKSYSRLEECAVVHCRA